MATMNVSLPDAMKDWVEAQPATGRYANASDYIRDLIRKDQERRKEQVDKFFRLKALVEQGRQSGISDMTFDEIWDEALQMAGQSAA